MINDRELSELSRVYPLLLDLPPPLREAVRGEAWRVAAPAGHRLFGLRDRCQAFLMVVGGTVRVTKPTLAGRDILLYRLSPGDTCILTVSCLLGRAAYPAVGVVEEDLVGYALPQGLFHRLLEQSSAFRAFVFRFFAERIAELMELVEEVRFQPLERRLAAALVGRGPVIYTTHQTLAEEVGSVREVVSRILKEFERQGLIRLARGRVSVLDSEGLQQLVHSVGDSSH
ncbi:MAG: Crp/Fnr family transcriptional regulator [Anaerolineae bacterium]|nr:Crp/Fnr family transcriptional regulator [Anaerolineae bacterium]